VIAPALLDLAAATICMGDLDEGEQWLQRAGRALEQIPARYQAACSHCARMLGAAAAGSTRRSR